MKRRTFIKALFGAAAAAVAAPAALLPEEKPKEGTIKETYVRYEKRPVEVEIEVRKVRACWTHEAEYDLRSMHNVEAERELTQVLADEINKEIDQEVLAEIFSLKKVA